MNALTKHASSARIRGAQSSAHKKGAEITKPGYHTVTIPKGKIGESTKILEEVLELMDAEKQGAKVMAVIELSDLVGAIKAYLERHVRDVSLDDLETMATITKRAFDNGHRK